MHDHDEQLIVDLLSETGAKEKARAQYHEALRLVEEQLRSDAHSFELRLRQAFYSARAEDCKKALKQMTELRIDLPDTARNTHRASYVYALCGERTLALETLRRTIELGTPVNILRQEAEFAALAEDAEFQALVDSP